MEENTTPQVETPQIPQGNPWWKRVDPRENIKGSLVLLALILLVMGGGAAVWNQARNNNSNPQQQPGQANQAKFLAANTIVYGYWTNNSSLIEAADLSTGETSLLATLPSNIKRVKVLSNNKLLYLKDTDENDYGKELVSYDLTSKNEAIIATADEGAGIDEYVISPNGKFISLWEFKLPQGSTGLTGGTSRVYSVDIEKPSQKNLIYDEPSPPGTQVHYPRAVTNSGDIFLDRFLPNSGAGWAYGMSVSNFLGTQKSNIASMANGTYSSQPIASPDGSKLLFLGYDGSRGDGTANVNGFRRALVFPNTIEVLDTATKVRSKLLSQANGIYQSVDWDLADGNILYTVYDIKNGQGTYKYNLSNNTSTAFDLPTQAGTIKTSLSGGKILTTNIAQSDSTLGNLGTKYENAIDAMHVFDPSTRVLENVNQKGTYVQFIGIVGPKYFASSSTNGSSGSQGSKTAEKQQLQLGTFIIKPTLAPERLVQQSQPVNQDPGEPATPCTFVSEEQCNQMAADEQASCGTACSAQDCTPLPLGGQSCFMSPLYLYGKENTSLNVSLGIPIYSVNAPYTPEKGFDIKLLGSGQFYANGKAIDSLSFGYTSAVKKLTRPSYGALIKHADLENTIREFAQKLGLNDREAEDTVLSAKEKINAPYVFVSFYDDALSKQILPIYFSTQPDSYRNIVFYLEGFDKKPNLSPVTPVFEKVVRNGFTAVEISFIIK